MDHRRLQFKAIIYDRTTAVALYNGDVSKSDIALPDWVHEGLVHEIRKLVQGPEEMQIVLPGTNDRQRDLIPVALFPVIYGKTRALPDRLIGLEDAITSIGNGEVVPCPEGAEITREETVWRVAARADIKIKPYNKIFKFLPCDLSLIDGEWRIVSYINNLHPVEHRELYRLIEKLIDCTIPLFNSTLTPLKDMLHSRARIEYTKAEYYPLPRGVMPPAPGLKEPEAIFDARLEEWRMRNLTAVQPDVGRFIPWAVPRWMMPELPSTMSETLRIENAVDINEQYGGRGLQAIVRVYHAELTPENPTFENEWHVEGQMVSTCPNSRRHV